MNFGLFLKKREGEGQRESVRLKQTNRQSPFQFSKIYASASEKGKLYKYNMRIFLLNSTVNVFKQ